MSLINQVLQDLDARRATYGTGTNLPNDVRSLPKPGTPLLPIVLGAAGLILLIAIVGGYAFLQWQARQEAAPVAQPAEPVVAASSRVSPTAPPTPAPPESSTSSAEPPSSVTPLLLSMDGSLRLADSTDLPSAENVETKAVTATAPASGNSAAAGMKDTATEQSRTKAVAPQSLSPDAAVPKAAGKSEKKPMIERTDAVGSPRERAEGEYRKAIAAVNQGRVAEALEELRNALRQDGLHVASRQLLVRLLLEARQPDEAAKVLQDGLQGQPAQIGWAMSLARLQVDRGDLAGAWQTLDYSSPAAGNNADYQGFMAHVLQRLGRNRDAAKHYQAATRLSPDDGRWWLGLGLALEAEGQSGEAREMFLRARQTGNLGPQLTALIEQKLR